MFEAAATSSTEKAARHGNRDAAHHYNEENSPADAGNRVANRI